MKIHYYKQVTHTHTQRNKDYLIYIIMVTNLVNSKSNDVLFVGHFLFFVLLGFQTFAASFNVYLFLFISNCNKVYILSRIGIYIKKRWVNMITVGATHS
jgi:hypothetical protein